MELINFLKNLWEQTTAGFNIVIKGDEK